MQMGSKCKLYSIPPGYMMDFLTRDTALIKPVLAEPTTHQNLHKVDTCRLV